MAEVVRRRIPFGGRRSITAPATCAQRQMWNLIRQELPDAAFYDFCLPVALPAGCAVRDVLAATGELLRRHESLRTAFGTAADGTLVQRVVHSGTFEAEICTAGPAEDPQSVLAAWRARMRERPFDLDAGPPLRAMVAVVDGTPVLAAYCVSHLAADLMSMRRLTAELTRLVTARVTGRPGPPAEPARQPAEQARYERSPRGQALLARADAYWQRQLATVPATMFPAPATSPPSAAPTTAPVRYSAAMDSRAASLALPVLAERWRVSTSAVLLTAVALLLGRRAGLPACAFRLLSANRSVPELRAAVANLHQEVVATIDLRGESVREIARGAFAACTTAYANGLFDPDRAAELLRAAERDRGTRISLSCCFNDIRQTHEVRAAGAPAPAPAVRAAMADTVVEPHGFEEAETFFLVVDDEEPGWLRLVLNADTAVLTAPEVHAFLYDVERLLVECVEGVEGDEGRTAGHPV
ncbi:condensation domain-containing protein [Streptomyces venezuelae]|uniref:condensation domain-containing protein n=1 Tax=Streptomyces venezuelae TaxID=54571 RepID=UPI00168019A0|nr:condensation domain-containing protein [Streptomyces venezuelae]